jgi:hypothetical protein
MLDGFDPSTIQDESVLTIVRFLMNQIEDLAAKVKEQAAEIQRLRDENNHLRGEQGQPAVRPTHRPGSISSEAERATPQPRTRRSKQVQLRIDRTEVCCLDHAGLPPDLRFKGYQSVVIQDLRLTTETIRFRKETWYSPSTRRSYLATLPPGYHGQFGPGVKALAFTLAFESGLSEPKIHALFGLAGLRMSCGHLSQLLHTVGTALATERTAILAAGLASSPWQHIDTTSTRVAGTNQHCHILTNPLYTVYTTTPQSNRLSVLDVLRGHEPRIFWLDRSTERLMQLLDIPAKMQRLVCATVPREQMLTEAQTDAFLACIPQQTRPIAKIVKDMLAIAAYHAQRAPPYPVIPLLVCDDAPQWAMLTEELALCWVHDGRAYKRLEPHLVHHRQLRDAFLAEYWAFYRELRTYQHAPTVAEAARLRMAFATLFSTRTGYRSLDARIAITGTKQRGLLTVLEHPEVPLHNNPAERGARRRVRKRDVSLGPRTTAGAQLWDIGHTLVATAQQLGVNLFGYLMDRLGPQTLPSLAELITDRAPALRLGDSWEDRPERPAWKPTPVAMWHG